MFQVIIEVLICSFAFPVGVNAIIVWAYSENHIEKKHAYASAALELLLLTLSWVAFWIWATNQLLAANLNAELVTETIANAWWSWHFTLFAIGSPVLVLSSIVALVATFIIGRKRAKAN